MDELLSIYLVTPNNLYEAPILLVRKEVFSILLGLLRLKLLSIKHSLALQGRSKIFDQLKGAKKFSETQPNIK